MIARQKPLNSIIFLLALCLVLPGMATTAFAQSDEDLSAPLGKISWGDSKKQVVDKVRDQLLDSLRNRKDLKGDRVRMHREHQRVQDKVKEFEESYERLDNKAGYQVSVITDEFLRNNGESLMHIRDRVASRYYFFVDGGLYKMVVAYNQNYLKKVGFETFVVQVAKKYGKPQETEYIERDYEDVLHSATWVDGKTQLNVRDQREYFGTYVMSFGERATVARMEKIREARGETRGGSEGDVSARVRALTDHSDSDGDRNAVEGIIGDLDIDLKAGRPVDVQKAEAEEKKRQEEQAKEQKSKQAAAKKAKPKPTKKKKTTKRDFSDIEASSDDSGDLIIY